MRTIFKKLMYPLLILSILVGCNRSLDSVDNPMYDREKGEEFGPTIKVGVREIDIDEKEVTELEDGLKYIKLQLKDEHFPIVIHAVQMDSKKNKKLAAQVLSGKNTIKGREKVSSMVVSNSNATQEVVAAINGDFFNLTPGNPLGGQVINGKIQKMISPLWNTAFYTDEYNIPYMSKVVSKTIAKGTHGEFEVSDFNTKRQTDQLILYDSSKKDEDTGTNEWGGEVLLNPIGFEWGNVDINELDIQNLEFEVEKVTGMGVGGSMPIIEGKPILSGHGKAFNWINQLKVGHKVSLNISFRSQDYLKQKIAVTNLCGAQVVILKNTMKTKLDDGLDHKNTRNPRSAIGTSPDKNKTTMLVVEGRSEVSVGATLAELADICAYFNLADAVNLDGGGSSCVVAKGEVLNALSDNAERPVTNAIAFVKRK